MESTQTIYATEITSLGPEAPDFLDAGLAILFQTGAPPELMEISVLHDPPRPPREDPPRPGDVLAVGDRELRITAVGEKAWTNVRELGHVVLKFNGMSKTELPGEMYVEEAENLGALFQPGARLEIREASS